jgi:hypothetical protein
MPRLRRYVVPALLLLPLILLCGKLLLTPVTRQEDFIDYYTAVGRDGKPPYEIGWPWPFAICYLPAPENHGSAGIWYTLGLEPVSWWILIVDLTLLLGVLGAVVWSIRILWRRSGRGRRFSIRALLIAVAILAIGLGYWARTRANYLSEHRIAAQLHADVFFSRPPTFEGAPGSEEITGRPNCGLGFSYCGPDWLRRFLPDDQLDIFYRATRFFPASFLRGDWQFPIPSPITWDELRMALDRMPKIHLLELYDGGASVDLRAVPDVLDAKAFRQIDTVFLAEPNLSGFGGGGFQGGPVTKPTDGRLLAAVASLPRLRCLAVTPTDAEMPTIVTIKPLETIIVNCEHVSDQGLLRLAELPNLKKIVVVFIGKVSQKTFDALSKRIYVVFNFPRVG